MAFGNANKDCQRIIGAQKRKTDAMGYLRLCQKVGTDDHKAALLANAITGAFKKINFLALVKLWKDRTY